MIRRLVARSLRHRPGRSLLLLAGYALGVGVTVALLSIGSALVQQSRDRTLVGGGDLTVLPAGLDLETFRTGGASSLYFTIDQAPFLYRQVLAGPRLADRVAAAAPWIDDEVLHLELPSGTSRPVSAGGRIPGLARELGAPDRVLEGAWWDAPADRRWASPGDSALYAGLDAFHLPPPEAAGDSSWAEWHYFNVLLPEGRGWLYLTFMVAGEVPDGRWGGRLLGTLVTRREEPADGTAERGGAAGGGTADRGVDYRTRSFRLDVPAEEVAFSLVRPDLRIGGSTVALGPEGRYRLRAEIPPAADPADGGERPADGGPADGGRGAAAPGPALRVDLRVSPERRSHLPPLDVSPGGFPSGYVVPMLDGGATGRVCVGGDCRELDGSRAYHDHNWGSWSGVAWDWGHARAGTMRLLYGGVRRSGTGRETPRRDTTAGAHRAAGDGGADVPDEAAADVAGRRFLFVTDSLGFAGLFTVDVLEHRWGDARAGEGAAGPDDPPRRRPRELTVRAVRAGDTVRLRAGIVHARSTRPTEGVRGERPLLFWQMRGRVRLEGRMRGRPLEGTGDGFFETWAPDPGPEPGPDAADAATEGDDGGPGGS